MRVLVSGASIAGPVLAYWLATYGHEVTVVERAPTLRKTGGHAVDLFKPALIISEKMGVSTPIQEMATRTCRMTMYRTGVAAPVSVDLSTIFRALSDQHVEIMRDDLSEIYYRASADKAEYVFGDSIAAIGDDGEVTFEHRRPGRFDVIVGADGLHSNVRRLVFGAEVPSFFTGAHFAVVSVPDRAKLDGEMTVHLDVGRTAGIYSAPHISDARAVFLFRAPPFDHHHRDIDRQKHLLREAFQGMHPHVDDWLAALDGERPFYFDSITQLLMTSWSRGRVTLVGDAGYCPGPVVGGSTSLAVLGAYVLAGELNGARGDHARAMAAYERQLAEPVRRSRDLAVSMSKRLIPQSRFGIWGLVRVAQLVSVLPTRMGRAVIDLNARGARLFDQIEVRHYEARSG